MRVRSWAADISHLTFEKEAQKRIGERVPKGKKLNKGEKVQKRFGLRPSTVSRSTPSLELVKGARSEKSEKHAKGPAKKVWRGGERSGEREEGRNPGYSIPRSVTETTKDRGSTIQREKTPGKTRNPRMREK